MKILIVGGYGTFGGRLVELLEDAPGLTLVVAGRAEERAAAFCASRRHAAARLVPAYFDRARDIPARLAALQPDVVVDATGPFQDYGENAYALVQGCIARGVHYMDLADGSDFVAGISAFDAAAREAGVFVLSGVSSFPVLTAAVVKELSQDMAEITDIRGGIAPSPYAGVGANVIRAIASYAGQEIEIKHGGGTRKAWPLTETARQTIAPPGRLPLGSRLFSLVDVPDLRVLAARYPQAYGIWMGAAPVPEILHRALIACAWLVRKGLAKSLRPLAPLMDAATRWLRWGEDRGGMFVCVSGIDYKGAAGTREWHLLAEGRDGPLIPSMAVEAIVRKMLGGRHPAPGARAAVGEVTLEDYDALFARRTICTGRRHSMDDQAPLYQKILGPAWETLPAPLREMHDMTQSAAAEGVAQVARGRNPLARLVCRLIGFPDAGADVPVRVDFRRDAGGELWTRSFGGKNLYKP